MNSIEEISPESASDKKNKAEGLARNLGLSISFDIDPNLSVEEIEEIYEKTLEVLKELGEKEINKLKGSNIVIKSLDDLKQINSDSLTEKVEEIKKAIGKEGKILRPGDRVFWGNNLYSRSGVITSFKLGNPPNQGEIFAMIDTGPTDLAVRIEASELSLIEIRPILNSAQEEAEKPLEVKKTPVSIEDLRLKIKEKVRSWFNNLNSKLEYALFEYFIKEYSGERTEKHLDNWNGPLPKGQGTKFVANLADPAMVENPQSKSNFVVEVGTGDSLLELLRAILERQYGS